MQQRSPWGSDTNVNNSCSLLQDCSYTPFNLRQELGLKDSASFQSLWKFATEKQTFGSEVQEHVSDNLSKIHPTDHLLIPESDRKMQGIIYIDVYWCKSLKWWVKIFDHNFTLFDLQLGKAICIMYKLMHWLACGYTF